MISLFPALIIENYVRNAGVQIQTLARSVHKAETKATGMSH